MFALQLRAALHVARHELLRRARDPFAFAVWLLIPIGIATLIQFVFGSSDPDELVRGELALIDRDGTHGSAFFAGALGWAEERLPFDLVALENERDARAAMLDGEYAALLILPEGFGDALIDGGTCEAELVLDPSETVIPRVIQETLTIALEGHRRVLQLDPGIFRRIMDASVDARGELEVAPAAVAFEFFSLLGSSLAWMDPPRVDVQLEVESTEDVSDSDTLDLSAIVTASLLLMTIVFLAVGQSEDLGVEKDGGTLARALAAGVDPVAWATGKVAAGAVLAGLVASSGLALAWFAFGVRFQSGPTAVVFLAAVGALATTAAILLQSLGANQRAGNLLANGATFPLLMLGGAFFPLEFLPDALADIGRWTPVGLANGPLKSILAGQLPASELANALGVVLSALILVTALLAHRLPPFAARG